ncbi:MAG: AbrB/MazE/SpoVT family DNA-binding domain-containing protein [Burkholderiaceae bacterium]
MLQTSKLTSKFQTTVPFGVRKALNLRAGDLVAFEVNGSEIRLKRATPLDVAFAQALTSTLDEWASAADDKAFKDL